MTTRLKKKNKSSLDVNYVDDFIKNLKEKLNNFDIGFLTPYKEKLDKLDSSVITDITKDLKAPTLIIKESLDELWNYHWILGQKDVLQDEKKKIRFGFNDHRFVEFTTDSTENTALNKANSAEIDRIQLKEINNLVIKIQKQLKEELRKKQKYQNKNVIEANRLRLKTISNQLDQYLGSISNRKPEQQLQRFKSIEVRIRDLRETVRTMELQIESNNQNTSGNTQQNRIDILNSTEFGTVYQNRRTLLLGSNYAQDHKTSIITSVKKYFNNNEDIRPNTREASLFKALTKYTLTAGEKARQENNKKILSLKIALSAEDGTALDNAGRTMDLKTFIKALGTSDKSVQDYINSKSIPLLDPRTRQPFVPTRTALDNELKQITTLTNKSPLFKDLTNKLIDNLTTYRENIPTRYYQPRKVRKYTEDIEPIIKEILTLEKRPIKRRGEYLKGYYDEIAKEYKTIEELKEGQVNTLNLNRIKKMAETEISVAYNLGRLKKLQELGYEYVQITNEAENIINRERVLSSIVGNFSDQKKIAKAYRSKNSEDYRPILCTYCISRDGELVDINKLYGTTQKNTDAKVSTRYGIFDPTTRKRYSFAPPFHVSCWCYFVGVDDPKAVKGNSTNLPPIPDSLILSGVGLLSVAGAYLAFNKLSKNPIATKLAQSIGTKIDDTKDKVAQNVEDVFNNILRRPKVNLPINLTPKQIQESKQILGVSNEVFDQIESNTKNLLSIPKVARRSEDAIFDAIDDTVVNKNYRTLNDRSKNFNNVLEDIPNYVKELRPIVDSRDRYYTLRNILYNKTIPIEVRQQIYTQYVEARKEYETLISNHLTNTRKLKNTVNNIQSQITVDVSKQIIANIDNLPNNISLEDALKSVKSKNALEETDKQLRLIRNNLIQERKGIQEKINIEGKVIDNLLDGIDTKRKATDLKDSYRNIRNISEAYIAKNKALDKIVSNIDSIKKELNNSSSLGNTRREVLISKARSNNPADRDLLLKTQEEYIKKIIKQQERIVSELKKLPSNNRDLDNYVNLYRSEIQNKVNNKYNYSKDLWNDKELVNLEKQYKKISDIVTTRNTYESYLEETEEMLTKLSNFEKSLTDNTIKFSNYESDIIKNKEIFNKISRLPSVKEFKI